MKAERMKAERISKEKQCFIKEVRTTEECRRGNAKASLNIPLHELQERLEEIKALK